MKDAIFQSDVLGTDVAKLVAKLEKDVLVRCIKWKKTYRYSVTNYFIEDVKRMRMCVLNGLAIDKQFPEMKMSEYSYAKAAINNIECDLLIMNSKDLLIISDREMADFVIAIKEIDNMIGRLMKTLSKAIQ